MIPFIDLPLKCNLFKVYRYTVNKLSDTINSFYFSLIQDKDKHKQDKKIQRPPQQKIIHNTYFLY